MKKLSCILIFILAVTLTFSACGVPGLDGTSVPGETRGSEPSGTMEATKAPEADATESQQIFRILTTETFRDEMNYQIKDAVKLLQKSHPNLKIEVEYFPTEDSDERDILLTQLRTEIIAGNGPDVYILPTADYNMPLFTDVQQTIANGHFLDISSYYDADTALDKEDLNTVIMDAGLWEGGRYVLPLRYDMAVYVVDTDRFSETGKNLEWLANTNVQAMMDEALAEGNELLAKCAYPCGDAPLLAYFPNSIDYVSDNVLLTEETLAQFWTGVNRIISLTGDQERFMFQDYQFDYTVAKYIIDTSMTDALYPSTYFAESELPIDQTVLSRVVSIMMVNRATDVNDTVLPVRSVDGSTTAWVTWYGAVGSGCDDPALAYEYLRYFLTEEFQWELNRPTVVSWKEIPPESTGMVAAGWPVRYKGMADYITGCYMRDFRHYESSPESANLHGMLPEVKKIEAVEMTAEDMPFLDIEIDNVYFPVILEKQFYSNYYYSNLDMETLGCPDLMDPAEMAKDTLKRITVQVAEG